MPLHGKKVLVAEDTASIAYALRQMLAGMGADAFAVADGEKALETLRDPRQGPWDIVILDSRLPGIGGLEVLAALRKGETLAHTATLAVVYTATASSEFVETCETLGADGIFLKPLSFSQLRQQLEKIVASRGSSQGQQAGTIVPDQCAMPCTEENCLPSRPVKRTDGELRLWNRNAALVALDNDATVLKKLVEVLAGELSERLAVLDTALATADLEQLRRTAHACKNSAGVMRLDRLRAAAAAAESTDVSSFAQAAQTLRYAMTEAMEVLHAELEASPLLFRVNNSGTNNAQPTGKESE